MNESDGITVGRKLEELNAHYLEFTKTRGAMRCMQEGDDPNRARGLYFECPVCVGDKKHGCVYLFAHKEVALGLKPEGRWTPVIAPPYFQGPGSLSNLELHEEVYSRDTKHECAWRGRVLRGLVMWKEPDLDGDFAA